MIPQDIEIIRKFHLQQDQAPVITLSAGTEAIGRQMSRFCDELRQLNPLIKLKKDSDIPFQEPVMVIGRHNNIAYHAVPTGKLLHLFLQALIEDSRKQEDELGEDLAHQLSQLNLPVALKSYVATQCPHCPDAVWRLQILASGSSMIRLRIINAELFPEWTQADQIRSVPTIILDDQFRWSGNLQLKELLTMSLERDPSQLSSASLRQIIEDGDAQRVANMMVESGQVFTALVELLTHERWSVRLGAMVAAEYLADQAPSLALELSDQLWRCFSDIAEQTQGDVLHVIGQVKSQKTRSYLEKVISGSYGITVKEAAFEILNDL
ncbi:MAG: thioredoxin family protein [Desulfobacteraceae bacterium]